MLFENIKKVNYKCFLLFAFTLILLALLFSYITSSVNAVSKKNQYIYSYTVKVRDTVESLDKIFERAEVNVNVMSDAICNSYDAKKQKDEAYNLRFIDGIDGLIKSVLSNSPNVDGAWFQVNADLPFSAHAYNWYEFRENQFIDVKDQFDGTASSDRKITPEEDPYYFGAIANQKSTWSDIYLDADTKNSMMTISSPIYKSGVLVGVVGIDISTDNLQQTLANMQSVLGKSDLYLLNKDNNVILSQTFSNSNSTQDNYSFSTLFNEKKEGPVEYYDHLIKKTAIKLTLSNDYKIVIAVENKLLFSETNQIINIIYILFTLLILVIILLFVGCFKFMNMNQPTDIVDENLDDQIEQKDEKLL